jgi:GT2 family glycosyltransferase
MSVISKGRGIVAERRLTFSVVVPTFGRPRRLARHLEAMLGLAYSPDQYELIVVDDGGSAPLEEVVAPFRKSLPLSLLRQEHAGPGAARNTGAQAARGRYLAFTADDCEPAEDWLCALERCLSDHPGAMIGGGIANGVPESVFSTTNQLLIDYMYQYHNRNGSETRFFTPNNLALPTDLYHRVGGFDASMGANGEDREFCARWRSLGLHMISAPDAMVRHAHPQSIVGFWRQHIGYGRGSMRFHRRSRLGGLRFRGRLTPEPLSFYWDLVRYPSSRSRSWRGIAQSSMMLLCQCANGVGSLLELLHSQYRAPAHPPRR